MQADSPPPANPYAPATEVEVPGVDFVGMLPPEFLRAGRIPFQGEISEDELDRYLKLSSARGLLTSLGITTMLFAAVAINAAWWPWQLLLGGIVLAIILLALVLSVPYRRRDYTSNVVNWNGSISGYFDSSGYYLDDGTTQETVTWACISTAYADEQLVAFQSAIQTAVARLFTPDMFQNPEHWESLVKVAEAIHCADNDYALMQHRIDNAKAMVLSAGRPRLLPVPPAAIAFEGEITAEDVSFSQPAVRTDSRWARAVLAALLIAAIASVLSGITGLVLGIGGVVINPLDTLLVIGAMLCLLIGIFFAWASRYANNGNKMLMQTGFTDAEALTLDAGIFALRIPWNNMIQVASDHERIVLLVKDSRVNMLLRSDMFASAEDWHRTERFVNEAVDPIEADE